MHLCTHIPCKCTRASEASVTRHIRRTRRIRPAADAQLPVVVPAPALDPAPAHNRACMVRSQGDGGGCGDACEQSEEEGGGKSVIINVGLLRRKTMMGMVVRDTHLILFLSVCQSGEEMKTSKGELGMIMMKNIQKGKLCG
jgi:hypothetical protein